MNIVTGYRGEPHITALQDRMTNRGIIGTGKYVLDGATQMTASIISNNEIRIYGGTISINGCIAVIENGSYESAAIESGAQGMNRIDLIYAKYQKDSVTGVESVSVAVRKGTATAGTPEPPAVWAGDVDDGSSTVEMGLYLVTLTGVNITGLDRYSSPIPTVYSMGTTKLDRTGDAQYTTMTFNSSDALDPVSTVSVGLLSTGATLRSIIEKVSGAVRNLRYVMKQVGSAAIANVAASITEAIGNTALGTTATTLSGAIAEHETNLAGKQAKINYVTLFENINYTTQAANAWERIGVSFTVPANHRYIAQLASSYNQGKPIGLGVVASTTATRPNFLIQADEVQRYTLILGAGTWYVMVMRSGTGTNRYDGSALDIQLN